MVAENHVLSLILTDVPMETVVCELEELVRVRPLGMEARIALGDVSPDEGRGSSPPQLAINATGPGIVQWSTPIRRRGGGLAGAVIAMVQRTVERSAVTLAQDIARLAELALDRHEAAATLIREARLDAVTGLPNRRQLFEDLEQAVASHSTPLLILYDLDGFKQYHDAFGHPAGDALLGRLGDRLDRAVRCAGTAYRMGGDEFCVLIPAGEEASGDAVIAAGAAALAEHGEGFSIACSYGSARVGSGRIAAEEAMRIADQRLYAGKQSSRASASRQSPDVLLSVLAERHPGLGEHSSGVAALALRTSRRPGLDPMETRIVGLAAELHDIGKMAIPDAILDKRAEVNSADAAFMQRHTIIGERIVAAAPRSCRSLRSSARVTSAWTGAAIRTASRAPRSRSPRVSSPSATPTTPWSAVATTANRSP